MSPPELHPLQPPPGAPADAPGRAPTRTETDSFGPVEVPAHALWGAQTQRSRHFFAIGEQRMPMALSPHIGYDRTTAIAGHAHRHGTSLREAALASGEVTAADFDRWVQPSAVAGPGAG